MKRLKGEGGHAALPGVALPHLIAREIDRVRAHSSFTGEASGAGVARPVAVAFSGGLDSAVLLTLAAEYCAARSVPLFAFHVHHGLSPNADAWLAHCAQAAAACGASFDLRRVTVPASGSGTEASARKVRYAALGDMCLQHGVPLLLTAHHSDDQAETVLLQLLRGSGPAGLAGMDASNLARTLLGTDAVTVARPLLSASRAALEEYARASGLAWIEDESNADTRFARNALRHQVLPALAAAFPGFQERFARAAAHARSAQRLLDELAEQDLAACSSGDALVCATVRALSVDRANNLLRHWFHQRGLSMPSTAWLHEMREQALDAVEDAQVKVVHPECEVRRHRGLLYLTPRRGELPEQRLAFRWNGEPSLAFPAFGGALHFEPAAQGLDPEWLRSAALDIGPREGGERVKLAPNRPTRSLKQHYQSLNVPAWERERAPIVRADGQLIYAGSVGMDCAHMTAAPGLVLRWHPLA